MGAIEGYNDFGKIGYGGPCPPKTHNYHRYFLKLYALKSKILVNRPVTKEILIS